MTERDLILKHPVVNPYDIINKQLTSMTAATEQCKLKRKLSRSCSDFEVCHENMNFRSEMDAVVSKI